MSRAPKLGDGADLPDIIVLLILGVLMVVAFFFWEKYVTDRGTTPPLMRLQLWTRARGKLASVYLIGFAQWMGFSVGHGTRLDRSDVSDSQSLFYHATLYYQEVQGTGSIGAMLRFLPCAVSGVLCNVVVAVLIRRVPTQWLVCVGVAATGQVSLCHAWLPVLTLQRRQHHVRCRLSYRDVLGKRVQRHVALRPRC